MGFCLWTLEKKEGVAFFFVSPSVHECTQNQGARSDFVAGWALQLAISDVGVVCTLHLYVTITTEHLLTMLAARGRAPLLLVIIGHLDFPRLDDRRLEVELMALRIPLTIPNFRSTSSAEESDWID
jgi:hypothetical protein